MDMVARRAEQDQRNAVEREFVELRKAAARVAAWEHKEDPEIIKLDAAIVAVEQEGRNLQVAIRENMSNVREARAAREKYLEQFIPEGLRKVEKQA